MMNRSFVFMLLGSLLASAVLAADDVSFTLPSFQMNIVMNTRENLDLDDLPDRLVYITNQHLTKVFNKVLLSSSGGSIMGSAVKQIDLSTTLKRGRDQYVTDTTEWRSSLLADFEGEATFHTGEHLYVTDDLVRGVMKFALQNKLQLRVLVQMFQADELLKHVLDMSVEIEEKQTDDSELTPTSQGDLSMTQDDRTGISKGGIAALTIMLCLVFIASVASLFVYRRYCRHAEVPASDADDASSKGEKSTDDEASSTTDSVESPPYPSDEEEGLNPMSHLAEWGSWALAVSLPTKPPPPRRSRRATLKKQKSSLMRLSLNVIEEEQDGDDDASLRQTVNSVRPVKDENADVWSVASSSSSKSGGSSLVEL